MTIQSKSTSFHPDNLHRRVLTDNLTHFALITWAILLEHIVRLGLCGRLGIGVIEKILDTEKNLFDCNCRSPAFFFVQD